MEIEPAVLMSAGAISKTLLLGLEPKIKKSNLRTKKVAAFVEDIRVTNLIKIQIL